MLRLLVIDDDDALRDAVTRYLRRVGYEVEARSSAAAACRAVGDHDYALILCDLGLGSAPATPPGGLVVYEAARARGIGERVVFLTGGASEPAGQALLDAHPDRVWHKPLRLTELAARVERRLRRE
jgi:two-component system response regulator MprA